MITLKFFQCTIKPYAINYDFEIDNDTPYNFSLLVKFQLKGQFKIKRLNFSN
jgi:hypothetical protein